MTPSIRLTFLQTGETAVADLRPADAPLTCAALAASLPTAAVSHHASYSGSEGVLVLPRPLRVEPENATAEVSTGDVGFTWFAAGAAYGVTSEFAEICWFYDIDARPSMHEGPVPVSIFARFREGSEAFCARCRAMRRSGVASMLVEPEGGASGPTWRPYHDPNAEAPLVPAAVRHRGVEVRLAIDPLSGECRVLSGGAGGGALALGIALPRAPSPILGASLACLTNGWLAAVVSAGSTGELLSSLSSDGGATWTELRPIGLQGADPALVDLGQRGLGLAYADGSGVRVAVSKDAATAWRNVRMPAPGPAPSAGGATLERPVALRLGDGRLACGACSPNATTPDWVTVVALQEEDR